MNKRGQVWLLLLAFGVVLGCSDSPNDSRDAGSHRDAAPRAEDDGGTRVPADQDAAASAGSDAGQSDGAAGGDRDSGMPPDPCAGDVVLEADDDVAAIAECTRISGSLTLTGEGLTTVELPLLETVDGNLALMASGLDSVELPALAFVGQDLRVFGNKRLVRVALPLLATTIGSVRVGEDPSPDGQPMLSSIELPSLREVGGDTGAQTFSSELLITGNRALSTLALPELEQVSGSVAVSANPALTALDLPGLGAVQLNIYVDDNAALAAVRMPALVGIGGRRLWIGGRSLASLDLSALQIAGMLVIRSGADLHDVQLPELEHAEAVAIGPTTATSIVLPKLVDVYSSLSVSDNSLLTDLELPVFSRVGWDWVGPSDEPDWGVYLQDNAQLTSVELPALKLVGSELLVQRNPLLASLTLTSLQEVRETMEVRGSALDELSAPMLAKVGGSAAVAPGDVAAYGDLTIADNPSLQSLDLPLLDVVGHGVEISDNASLPTCDAEALGAQLTMMPEHVPSIVIDGNAGTCPWP